LDSIGQGDLVLEWQDPNAENIIYSEMQGAENVYANLDTQNLSLFSLLAAKGTKIAF
jgi:hypothetical protein